MAIGPEGEALVAIDKLIDKYVAELLREDFHKELMSWIPEKVEVMSEEEIKNKVCNFCVKSRQTLACHSTDTCLAVRFAIGALSGRIAKPEVGKPVPQSVKGICICKPKERILCRSFECNLCHKCNLPIKQQKPVEKIEKLNLIYADTDSRLWNLYLIHFMDKINELVKAVNELKEGR